MSKPKSPTPEPKPLPKWYAELFPVEQKAIREYLLNLAGNLRKAATLGKSLAGTDTGQKSALLMSASIECARWLMVTEERLLEIGIPPKRVAVPKKKKEMVAY